jgi:hypothetical protein
MARNSISDPVLMRFRAVLSEMYGDRIDRVVLFAPARAATRVGTPATMSLCSCATWMTGTRRWIGLPTLAPTSATRLARSFTRCPIGLMPALSARHLGNA